MFFGLNALIAQTLLFSDNFKVADTNNFKGASTAGRLSGILANDALYSSVKVCSLTPYLAADLG